MEYRRHIESKIVRTEHHVVVWTGGSAAKLMHALRSVPINATLTDIVEGEGSRVTLVFTTEDAVQPSTDAAEEKGK